jgi:hypothetical protein
MRSEATGVSCEGLVSKKNPVLFSLMTAYRLAVLPMRALLIICSADGTSARLTSELTFVECGTLPDRPVVVFLKEIGPI